MEKRTQDGLTKFLFIVYLAVMTWIILFKMSTSIPAFGSVRVINLNPMDDLFTGNLVPLAEKMCNIIIFMPFGVYLGMLKKDWSFFQKVFAMALVSLLYEVLQFVFAIGTTDICDLINNTLGGTLGLMCYIVVMSLFKNKRKIRKLINVFASLGTVCVVTTLTLVILTNGFY